MHSLAANIGEAFVHKGFHAKPNTVFSNYATGKRGLITTIFFRSLFYEQNLFSKPVITVF
ncbi:hypothetical protein JCM15831A_16520 [Asaia astilbis]